MKTKILPRVLLSFLLISLLTSFSVAQKQKAHLDKLPTLERSSWRMGMPILESVNTLLDEDFQNVNPPGLPSGWTSISPEGDYVTGDADYANQGGYFPVPDIPGNIFAMANDDLCNCDMSDIELITPTLDLTGLNNMVLRFNCYHDKNWGGGDAEVQVSTDGGSTWSTIKVLNSATSWQYYVLDLSSYSGVSNFKVKFQWSDDGTWASGFAVDNVVVDELLNNDLRVEKVHTTDLDHSLEYTMLPKGQTDPMIVGSRVKNNGSDLQINTKVHTTILQDGNPVYTDSSSPVDIDSMQRNTYWINTTYSPDTTGKYTVRMDATSDQLEEYPADNELSDSVDVTCGWFGRDRDSYNGDAVWNGLDSNGNVAGYEVGNIFELRRDIGEVSGVDVLFDQRTDTGSTIKGRIYRLDTSNGSLDTVATGMSHKISSSDISTPGNPVWKTLRFEGLSLDSGEVYLAAMVHQGGGSDSVFVGTSGISPHNTSYLIDKVGSDTVDVNATPMVRLNVAPFVVGLAKDTTICAGDSITLNAGQGDSYTWNTGATSPSIEVSTPGTYSVTVTRDGCQSVDSIAVDTSSILDIDLGPDTTICEGESIDLDAGPGDSFTWNTGAQTPTITVDSAGIYSVSVVKGPCQGSDSISVDTMSCNNSVKDVDGGGIALKVYPNPVTKELNYELDQEDIEVHSVTVLDMEGRIITFKEAEESMKGSIRMDGSRSGTYFIRIRTEDGRVVQRKFIKNQQE